MNLTAETLDTALFEELFDALPGIVFFVKDRAARYVLVNQTLVRRCGARAKSELLGKTALQVFPAAFGRAYHAQDRQVIERGASLRDELELHLYARGEAGWCLTNKIPRRDAMGNVAGLIGLSVDLHVPADVPSGYKELALAVAHMRSRFDEPLRVEDLAGMASLSVFQFEQRMKRVFQLTAGQFILKTRVDAACDRLKATRDPIADIALACGFYDQSAFTRQFKATTGLTPGQYRARAKWSATHYTSIPCERWDPADHGLDLSQREAGFRKSE